MDDPRIKQLKIKTGVVKRIAREKVSYEKEAEQIQEKIKQMQDEGKEVYYIRKQDELLQETLNVIPDCQRRLNSGYKDLKNLIENEAELEEREEYQTALEVLAEAQCQITE